MKLYDLLDTFVLEAHIAARNVREQAHPTLPLRILNYTEQCAYTNAWDDVTKACRGLIYDAETLEVVARPFPKFFNHGQPGAPELDLEARAVVTEKMDGSLGILYPDGDSYAIATRGSFTSEQAIHATETLRTMYADWCSHPTAYVGPLDGWTYLFEIIYPTNRVVCDYGQMDDLVLLSVLSNDEGVEGSPRFWPGPRVSEHPYASLAEALAAAPRPNAEGLVVTLLDDNGFTVGRVKIKQDDYVALHRILTGTNARNVWEVAAVHACAVHVTDPKQWGSFLRIDPARAAEVLTLADGWLEQAGIPDEFYGWVEEVTEQARTVAGALIAHADSLIEEAAAIADRRTRYEHVNASGHPAVQEIMRLADGRDGEYGRLVMRCWHAARPEPTAPFARSEAVA